MFAYSLDTCVRVVLRNGKYLRMESERWECECARDERHSSSDGTMEPLWWRFDAYNVQHWYAITISDKISIRSPRPLHWSFSHPVVLFSLVKRSLALCLCVCVCVRAMRISTKACIYAAMQSRSRIKLIDPLVCNNSHAIDHHLCVCARDTS